MGLLFKKGQIVRKVPENHLTEVLLAEIDALLKQEGQAVKAADKEEA